MAEASYRARLTAITYAAQETNLYEFRRMDAALMPAATAGAHIDVHLPNGMLRQYSLVHAGEALQTYVIGVRRDRASRGGSRFLYEQLRVGAEIEIGGPRNHFPLDESAAHSVLIAGGIGITPIACMIERLDALGRDWQLHYSCRTREETAFLESLQARTDRVHFNFDAENGGRFLDLAAIVSSAPHGAQFYCCGPTPMLKAFEVATAALAPALVHAEYFTAAEQPAAAGGFVVELARSKREIVVLEGQTILDALRQAGVEVTTSCEQGVCGACETRVLAGTPEHRDMILSTSERAANKTMMVCCSGSKGARLTLDL